MTPEEKIQLIKTIPVEFFQDEELKNLVEKKENIICYDGFEPSGRMHIAQGLIRTINTNKLTKCGFNFKFWVADYFAKLNHKLGGDIKKIQKAGQLMIEIWKACGMNMEQVDFLWTSEEINKNSDKYWGLVMDISNKFNLNRIKKCTQIMGRNEKDDLSASQIFYPCMQCADIFYLGVDICSLGLDQRKVNMLAIEYCDKIKRKNKPIILSHPMLMALDGNDKMSKSNPDSAIFMDDQEFEVKKKINKAYCPENIIEKNPIIDYMEKIVFELEDNIIIPTKFNGNITVKDIQELKNLYQEGIIHPADIKPYLIQKINSYLEPVRNHFKNNPKAKQLLKTVKNYKITK